MTKSAGHKNRAHAILSASGAERWMACTPSARFEEKFLALYPEQDGSSNFAAEGTLAHEIAELELRYRIGQRSNSAYRNEMNHLKSNDLYYDGMIDDVQPYVDFVLEEFEAEKTRVGVISVRLFLEQRFRLERYIPESFGTNDSSIYSKDQLHIIDLKFGKGLEVSPVENKQLMIYALGALEEIGESKAKKVKQVKVTIVQPRLDSIETWVISTEKLLDWAINELKPTAEIAFKGDGTFQTGDHCQFCKAKPKCLAWSARVNELARLDFTQPINENDLQKPEFMDDEDLLAIYGNAGNITSWLKSIAQHLTNRAYKGEVFEGYKLVAGRSTRTFVKKEEFAEVLDLLGYEKEETHNTSLKGITAMEKLLKSEFDSITKGFIARTEGAAVLVKDSNKKQAIGTQRAIEDFK